MKCAIYSRKSTDDDNSPDSKSVERQVQHATAYAQSKGWEVLPEHIFIDDGISGAEFVARPGFQKLLECVKRKEVQFLIMSELSRLGRDSVRTPYHLTEIIDSGVRLFYYLNGEEEKLDSPEARLIHYIKSYADEQERARAGERSRDALKLKFEKGYSTGGGCYGYERDPKHTTNSKGEQVRSHTDFKIIEDEADIVRRVFAMYVDGYGHGVICKTLNGSSKHHRLSLRYFDGMTPPPRPRENSSGSWSPSSIYYMLRNERYVGILTFSRTRQFYKGGTKKREKQTDYLKTRRDDLRIIDASLWDKAQKRVKATQATYIRDENGHLWSKPDNGRNSRYLLSLLVKCDCGGNMMGGYFNSGSKRVYFYTCARHYNRGDSVCRNGLKLRMEELDTLVLDAIKSSVLDKDAIRHIIKQAMAEISKLRKEQPHKGASLKKELARTEKELANLVAAIASGNAPKTILAEIKKKENRIESLKADIDRYQAPIEMNDLDYKRLENELETRLARFEKLIFSDVVIARQTLRKLFKQPLRLKPEADGYIIEGETQLGALFQPAKVSPNALRQPNLQGYRTLRTLHLP